MKKLGKLFDIDVIVKHTNCLDFIWKKNLFCKCSFNTVVCQEHAVSECPAYVQLRRDLANLAKHKSEPKLDNICRWGTLYQPMYLTDNKCGPVDGAFVMPMTINLN